MGIVYDSREYIYKIGSEYGVRKITECIRRKNYSKAKRLLDQFKKGE